MSNIINKKLVIFVLIGFIIGLLEFLLISGREGFYVASAAFLHWVGTSAIISYTKMPISNSLKGVIISILSGLFVMAFLAEISLISTIIMFVLSILFGMLIGWLPEKMTKSN